MSSAELENCDDFDYDELEITDEDMFEMYLAMATKLKSWIKDDSMPLSSTLRQKSNPIVQEVIVQAPEDRKYQKFLWRFSEHEPIRTYELDTVTFGVKSAPHMAIASTFELANAEKEKFPEASNDVQVLNDIPIENQAINSSFEINKNESIKTLGTLWTPNTDNISFTIDMKAISNSDRIAKRKLLSDASKLYDPFGILSPITIKSKIMMQEIWKKGIEWDSLVHDEVQIEWNQYKGELPLIEQIKLSRWFYTVSNSQISLHGFWIYKARKKKP